MTNAGIRLVWLPDMTRKRGALFALLSALMFGVGTPLIKLRFSAVEPLLLSALINLGSTVGVALFADIVRGPSKLFTRENRVPFTGSLLFGAILGPVLLVWGIGHTPGSAAALLLNLEAAFTAVIAWLIFREHMGPRVVFGLVLTTLGGVVVSANAGTGPGRFSAGLAIAGACLCWAIDNNCTVRLRDVAPAQFTFWKGLISGGILLVACLAWGISLPTGRTLAEAAALGACCHGLALLVFVMALQRLGAGRTAAYFAMAPFAGAATAVLLLDDPVTPQLLLAAALMAGGVASLFTEPHHS
ncbi:MAG: DMT family transporter [Verrucomicrobiota bacterium]